jgi:hypothetical protein
VSCPTAARSSATASDAAPQDFHTPPLIPWPQGKQFAFSVFDDTDSATLENVSGVYSFLRDCGFRTTKSCWVVEGDPTKGTYPGRTCEAPDYLHWLQELQSCGFEIGWHGATWHGVPRPQILAALEKFEELFGGSPRSAAHHSDGEGMYWGDARFSGLRAILYNLMTACRNRGKHRGHVEGDEYFWGDLCKAKIKYYRDFVFRDINSLRTCPFMPYHDPRRPYVNYWFASSNGKNVKDFNRCISEANQDRLEAEGGVCIMYTHFALDFARGRDIQPRFASLMKRLAAKNGWFVPVSTLLDHILKVRGHRDITEAERTWMERRWLWEKAFLGTK